MTSLFSTENLSPEDFSLGGPWEAPPIPEVPEPTPEEPALPGEALPPAEEPAEAVPAGDVEEEETFQLTLPDRAEDEPVDAGSASINAILQEMQARAEELRRKMQIESNPEDDGQAFKLV